MSGEPAALGPHSADGAAGWVRDLVDGLTASFAPAWVRMFLTVLVVLGLAWWLGIILMRTVLPAVVPKFAPFASSATIWLGRAALLPEFLLTTGWRRMLGRPPAVSYWYGDAVTGIALTGARLMRPALGSARKLAKVPRLLVLVLVLAGFVWWNGTYCDDGRVASRCAQPVSTWTLSVKSWYHAKQSKPAKTTPKGKTKATPRPARPTARP